MPLPGQHEAEDDQGDEARRSFALQKHDSYQRDEHDLERMARMRTRPVGNKWIGQRLSDPDIDLAAMARAQGAIGFGPVSNRHELATALGKAIAAVGAGAVAVIDARVEPGYTTSMTAAMTRDNS